MNIEDVYATEFVTVSPDEPASKLAARFRDTDAKAVVVAGDGYEGVVTERQFLRSHVTPKTKVGSLVWNVPTVSPTTNVRAVARHLIGGQTTLLPVFEGENLVGVVTADGVLDAVASNLNVLSVADVLTDDPVTLSPSSTVGTALNRLREHRISHLPVVDDRGEAAGVVSVNDLLGVTTRAVSRSSGGDSGFREGRSHGGFGAREGDRDSMLDVPVRNVMTDVVEATTPETPLGDAVGTMLDRGVSSLVVTERERPTGIVTKTDALRSLTWTDERKPDVQVHHKDLMDDLSMDELRDGIEAIVSKYDAMQLLEANVYFHEHEERLRGTPLMLARIRLFTDKGHFVGTGEGYGAAHAFRLAANVVERQILEGKTRGRAKKGRDREERTAHKLYGWYLSGPGERG
ncbi:CBS domain-containing protein [Halobacterium litoreum]|uniref:CBS domain-containing protein n=1 Tax=Halobacterium litoreum TaxID=2039234 RepID=A0ABD5NEL5_9EURY|nr:CBS domain-containing protein [Halobacterium litoreum]UHH13789.1 CBS domain-containing protein [Halobacterium litoreum]